MSVDPMTLHGMLMVPAMAYMYTGLFITGHDAMHGNISRDVKVNDAIGQLATHLYAGFDLARMREKHMRHHMHMGTSDDPDFHDGPLLAWYLRFMAEYVDALQAAKLFIAVQLLVNCAHVQMANIIAYMAVAGILSSAQLFYFGTYVPHRPPEGGGTVARSTPCKTRLGSLLRCFHFDCHREHHAFPGLPWFRLWDARIVE